MTRERAAELLSEVMVLDDPEMAEAHRVAISALRQQEAVTNRNGLNEPLTMDELRMSLASACKDRDELKKELDAMRNELCYMCGKYREAHNGACDGCRWEKR